MSHDFLMLQLRSSDSIFVHSFMSSVRVSQVSESCDQQYDGWPTEPGELQPFAIGVACQTTCLRSITTIYYLILVY